MIDISLFSAVIVFIITFSLFSARATHTQRESPLFIIFNPTHTKGERVLFHGTCARLEGRHLGQQSPARKKSSIQLHPCQPCLAFSSFVFRLSCRPFNTLFEKSLVINFVSNLLEIEPFHHLRLSLCALCEQDGNEASEMNEAAKLCSARFTLVMD
jgi:hypothetical protein